MKEWRTFELRLLYYTSPLVRLHRSSWLLYSSSSICLHHHHYVSLCAGLCSQWRRAGVVLLVHGQSWCRSTRWLAWSMMEHIDVDQVAMW